MKKKKGIAPKILIAKLANKRSTQITMMSKLFIFKTT